MTALILVAVSLPFLAAGVVIVLLLKHLVGLWTGRDVMTRFRPEAHNVHHTEHLLGVHRMGKRP